MRCLVLMLLPAALALGAWGCGNDDGESGGDADTGIDAVAETSQPVPSKGGRMQLDDALALCLCDLSPGACNGRYQACWHPLESHDPEVRVLLARNSALSGAGRPRFSPIDPSELRFLGKLEDGKPVCPEGVRGRVGHLRRGIRRAPPDLLGESRHVWDEAAYETVAWCGPALGSEVLR